MNNNGLSGIKGNIVVQLMTKYFLLLTLIILTVICVFIVPSFVTTKNIITILKTGGYTTLLAISCMYIMRIGEMSFSVGAQATFAAVFCGWMLDSNTFHNYAIAVICGVAASTVLVALLAYFVIEWKVPSFIGSLGLTTILDSLVINLTGNKQMHSNLWPSEFTIFKDSEIFGVPIMIIVSFAIAIALGIFTSHTVSGRHTFCVGANSVAAEQAGVKVKKVKYFTFVLSGVVAGFAGILQSSNLGHVPHSLGSDYLMTAICAATLSATFIKPGEYNVPGTVVASLILVIIKNMVSNLGASIYLSDLITAAILLIGIGIIAVFRKDGLVSVNFT